VRREHPDLAEAEVHARALKRLAARISRYDDARDSLRETLSGREDYLRGRTTSARGATP